ncbi:hypothetical protein ACFYT4_17115 [Streptomyces sp. NPDC004609]|uniref:hypothetical protein n=1 Tax=Streptomyces sp. NPDC004609 TaxID=3364704 RepID=UPI00369D0576
MLRGIVLRHGWPGYRLVGRDGAEAAVDIAANGSDPPLLRRLLRLLAQAVYEDDAPWSGLPRLSNRLTTLERGFPPLGSLPARVDLSWGLESSASRARPHTEEVAEEVLSAHDPPLLPGSFFGAVVALSRNDRHGW